MVIFQVKDAVFAPTVTPPSTPPPTQRTPTPTPIRCTYHPQLSGIYICGRCGKPICRTCAKSHGDIMICPQCFPQPERLPHTEVGSAALVLGILGICIFWIPYVSIGAIVLGILALVFGVIGYHKLDNFGLYGLILGALAFALGIVMTILYFFVFDMGFGK